MDIILASGSPRRKELLSRIGITNFTVLPADIDEVVEPGLTPQEVVTSLARQKADAVAAAHGDALVIAADTVVVLEGAILGKPKDEADAAKMLTALSGRAHLVCTGLTLRQGDKAVSGCEVTEVTFRPLSPAEIAAYVKSGEPMDKAGAYGIQGLGSLLVSGLRGDYFNVMGLPLCRLGLALRGFGIEPLKG